MKRLLPLFTILLSATQIAAQSKTDAELETILKHSAPLVQQVLANKDDHRLQIIYTQIDRDKQNNPSFQHHFFNYDAGRYFNPASMVKMPLAFLALEKLHQMPHAGVDKFTAIQYDSSRTWMRPLYADTTAKNDLPSIAHFIKKAFLISDNDAYNRLYQFVGQQQANDALQAKGFSSTRIARQFMGLSSEQNRYTNPIRFLNQKGSTIASQPEAYNPKPLDFSQPIFIGNAHYTREGEYRTGPFDFTEHNNISLFDMQQMLQTIMFPQAMPVKQRFDVSDDDYTFLRYWLSAFPSETDDPKYDTAKFYDSYVKFFFKDSTHRMPDGVRVFNKVGWAYGFMIDVSYVVDFKHKIEYMLAASMYVNSDGVVNDSRYDEETIGFPFLRQLGETIYQHELQRKRKYKPDLSAFRYTYGHRDPHDKRPVITEADN